MSQQHALARLGLSGYAAKAYIALAAGSSATAKEVAQRAAIPKGRIYEVLEELYRDGAVEILPETPKRFRAVPFAELFDARLRARAEALEELRREREKLLASFGPAGERAAREDQDFAAVLRDLGALTERYAAVVARAERDILGLGGPADPERLLRARDVVQDALGRGVRWRLLVPVGPSERGAVEELQRWGLEVRHRPQAEDLALAVHDDARVVLLRGNQGLEGRDGVALFLEESTTAGVLRGLLEAAWKSAPPVPRER